MKDHKANLYTASKYIEKHRNLDIEDYLDEWQMIISRIQKFKLIHSNTRILEIGSGTAWFLILCKQNGISCEGLDISPHLVEYAKAFANRYNIELDLKLGNVESADIGCDKFDVIIANSVFEHVKKWQQGIKRVFRALKTGGLFYFTSTNKFSFIQGEHDIPFYSWLPNKLRYQLRLNRNGKDIMKFGIDFNQFTYFQLRRFFKDIGFSKVLDALDIIEVHTLRNPTVWKKTALRTPQRCGILKPIFLLYFPVTLFICLK